jgi:hypothetical protein
MTLAAGVLGRVGPRDEGVARSVARSLQPVVGVEVDDPEGDADLAAGGDVAGVELGTVRKMPTLIGTPSRDTSPPSPTARGFRRSK